MSFLGSNFPSGPGGERSLAGRVQDKRDRAENALGQHDLLNQGDDGISEAPRRRGIAARLRGLFRRDRSPAPPGSGEPL